MVWASEPTYVNEDSEITEVCAPGALGHPHRLEELEMPRMSMIFAAKVSLIPVKLGYASSRNPSVVEHFCDGTLDWCARQ